MTFKKSIIALALLGSSAAFAQSASYSTASFSWNRTTQTPVVSQATSTVQLTQGVDGTLSASGGVTFSGGQSLQQLTAAQARATYQTFANDVYGLVQTNVTAIRTAVNTYNSQAAAQGGTTFTPETLTIGAGGVTGTLTGTNNATLFGARQAVQAAMNTLHTNIGTANTSLSTARDAINNSFAANERTLFIDGTASWQAAVASSGANGTFHRYVNSSGSYVYTRVLNGSWIPDNESNSATWITHGSIDAPITQFQATARQF